MGRYLVELSRFSTNGAVAANLPRGSLFFITVVLFNYIGDALRDALDVSR